MYSFNEKRHIHEYDGKPLMGVTTVLSVIAKPALIGWAANMAVDFIDAVIKEGREVDAECLKEARSAHRKKKEAAGGVGTEIHACIEKIINCVMNDGDVNQCAVACATEDEIVQKAVSNFCQWARENNVKFLESEKRVYSTELWIGGILDMVFEMDGKRYIGDVKTSSAIYNEHFFQMAAYEMCLEHMGEPAVDGYIVINLKKDGTMDLKMAENREINREAFKNALGLHKIINSLE